MLFEYHITVPASTVETDPHVEVAKLTYGIIHYIEFVPWGYAVDMLHISIAQALHQVFPTNPDAPISFAGEKVEGKVYQPIDAEPYEVDIRGWNDSTLYPHSCTVRFWLLLPDLVEPPAGVFKKAMKWFETLIRPRR